MVLSSPLFISLWLFSILTLFLSLGYVGIVRFGTRVLLQHFPRTRQTQQKLIFSLAASSPLPLQTVSLHNQRNERLVAWWAAQPPRRNRPRAALILQHGYKMHRGEMLQQANFFYAAGYSVLLPAMRAHEHSEGTHIEFAGATEAEDIKLWHTYLTSKQRFHPKHIGFVGNSLGAAALLHAHAVYQLGAVLIIQSLFAELSASISSSVRYFTGIPGTFLAQAIATRIEKLTNIKSTNIAPVRWAAQITVPSFIMQGGADRAIPTTSGALLYHTIPLPPSQKAFWYDEKQKHVNFDQAYPQEYINRVIPFVNRALLSRPHST